MDHAPVIVRAFSLPGGTEWLVILVIALLLFGARLPAVMRSLGGSIKEFKKGMDEGAPAKPESPAPAKPETTAPPQAAAAPAKTEPQAPKAS